MTAIISTDLADGSNPVDPVDGDPHDRSGNGRGLWIVLLVAALALGGAIGWRIGRAQGDPTIPDRRSVDVGFFQDMGTHHNQAIGLAMTYLEHGTVPLLRQIGSEIVKYQASEIGVMNEYLTKWHAAGTEDSSAMRWMGMTVPRDQMMGLATKSQLAALEAARGRDLDQLFTRLMINHHVGGVQMATYAASHATTPEVKRWASAMAEGQRGEIAELNQWRVRNGFPAVTINL